MNKKEKRVLVTIVSLLVIVAISYINNAINNKEVSADNTIETVSSSNTVDSSNSLENVPEYTDKIYIEINNNTPNFTENDYTTEPFEKYSDLDEKNRCGVAYANICKEIMPGENEERKSISSVAPTGWQKEKYNGSSLYNRCHLIGYQLAGENANKLNLVTGTRYFNVTGMLPFENEVAEYIDKNENNHVLYRVTPDFKGDNLLCSGVEMEAYSVEDNGRGVSYNVYVYNVQPGVELDYATGKVIQ